MADSASPVVTRPADRLRGALVEIAREELHPQVVAFLAACGALARCDARRADSRHAQELWRAMRRALNKLMIDLQPWEMFGVRLPNLTTDPALASLMRAALQMFLFADPKNLADFGDAIHDARASLPAYQTWPASIPSERGTQ